MNIGDASAHCGLPVKTIRYYEDIGLIEPARRENGYRDYGDSDLSRLRFLQRARNLGFSIETCRSLLDLQEDKNRASAQVKRIAQEHLEEIDHKIQELNALRDTLHDVIDACPGDASAACPILEELADGGRRCGKV
ncbi:MAG: Cu(I)-responsive transcriptional regulator [Hyphomicrobiaceae bacterium]